MGRLNACSWGSPCRKDHAANNVPSHSSQPENRFCRYVHCKSKSWPDHSIGNLKIPNGTHTEVGETVINEKWESQTRESYLSWVGKNILIRSFWLKAGFNSYWL